MNEGLTVRDVAREAGVASSTVRLYARRGLLDAGRTSGNARRFGYDAPCRIVIAKAAQRVGLDLTTISAMLADLPDDATSEDWDRLNSRLVQEAERRIAELSSAIEDFSVRAPLCTRPLSPVEVRTRHQTVS